jgi:hypothetical protein
MLIAVFLPRVESTSFGGVAENTLIQSGDGWIFIALSIGVAAAAYRAYRQGTKTIAVIVLGVIAIALATYQGTNEDQLTLYPIGPGGDVDFLAAGEKATPAAGIYLAGIGGLLAAVGGFQMRSGPGRREGLSGPEATKSCPDCAETVLAAARVCRYCNYHFEPTADPSHGVIEEEADGASWRWRCDLCNAQFKTHAAAEKHAEDDHIEKTTDEAKRALQPLPH